MKAGHRSQHRSSQGGGKFPYRVLDRYGDGTGCNPVALGQQGSIPWHPTERRQLLPILDSLRSVSRGSSVEERRHLMPEAAGSNPAPGAF